jgi:hypothetical protein
LVPLPGRFPVPGLVDGRSAGKVDGLFRLGGLAGLVVGRFTPLPPLPAPGLASGRAGLVAGLRGGFGAGLVAGLPGGGAEGLVAGLLDDGGEGLETEPPPEEGRLTEGLLLDGGRENELPLLPPEGLE